MPSYEEKRLLPFSTSEMFAIVADIEKYPEFVPGCAALRILERSSSQAGDNVIAEMLVSFGALRERYTSKVTLDEKANTVSASHLEGPFDHLDTRWHFVPHGNGSEVRFFIDFLFRNKILAAASGILFDEMARKMIDAFVARAESLYSGSQHAQQ